MVIRGRNTTGKSSFLSSRSLAQRSRTHRHYSKTAVSSFAAPRSLERSRKERIYFTIRERKILFFLQRILGLTIRFAVSMGRDAINFMKLALELIAPLSEIREYIVSIPNVRQ